LAATSLYLVTREERRDKRSGHHRRRQRRSAHYLQEGAMKTTNKTATSLGILLGVVGGAGCVAGGGTPGDEVGTTDQAIQGGQLETGYPAVGQVLLGNGNFCTGTVIAPSYVLTAGHCAGAGMTFNTGTDASNFVGHPVDQQITHPTLDLLIAHLATPIAGVSLLPWSVGAPPAIGTVCTAVGFGW